MRAVVQRVSHARVEVDGGVIGEIGKGLLVLLGCGHGDGPEDRAYIVNKILTLRIFSDDEGKMNLAVTDVGAQVLVVSQFTLFGDARKGRRPSFMDAMAPDLARAMVDEVVRDLVAGGARVATGEFGADMDVISLNQGPVTILLDSRRTF
jgi:D-tyrosyl-tRNA(Tyr) deacylase